MSIIAFIPARGNSKGIKKKNIYPIAGKPLIYWVLSALEKSEIPTIVVATDSAEIKQTVIDFGFSKVKIYDREQKNAADNSATIDVVMEYFDKTNLSDDDLFCLVQATSPLLTEKDINNALKIYHEKECNSMFSCVECLKFCWTRDGIPLGHDYKHRKRRQDAEKIVFENGAFYINTVGEIKSEKSLLSGKILPYIMSPETITEIDEMTDIPIVEKLLKERIENEQRK